MTLPAIETPTLSVKPWCNICGHEPGFNQQGAGATHRINEGLALFCQLRPTRTDQQGRGQVFFQRCFTRLQAIAPTVEAVPGDIQKQRQAPLAQLGFDTDITRLIDRWTHARLLTEDIDHRIFDALRTKLSVVDKTTAAVKIDTERGFNRK